MSRAFSAPGKALFAGGYLVLDSFDSYVVALSARMHCLISSVETSQNLIEITSPQFSGKWEYRFESNEVTSLGDKNPFIESTIKSVLKYLKPEQLSKSLKLTIFSDKEYHSQQDTVQKGRFLFHKLPINDIPKTGLGSSAGLTTVVTAALLSQFINLDLSNQQHLNIIHNLAQFSHCQAQGKVGSGFDVAAATFGSIVYRRFDPELINSSNDEGLRELIDSDWKIKNAKVSLPKGIKLLMGDIKTGSNTPKLVSKVTAWKKSNPTHSAQIYSDLDHSNLDVIQALKDISQLSEANPNSYSNLLKFVSSHTSAEILSSADSSLEPFKLLINSILSIRENLRIITTESGAEIEPAQQTELLDACLRYEGVLGGVVPGAGGFDAISLLVSEEKIGEFVNTTRDHEDFKNVTWLDLSEESEGLKEVDPEEYLELQ